MANVLKDLGLEILGFGVGAGLSISFYVLIRAGESIVKSIQNASEVIIDKELVQLMKKETNLDVCLSGKVISEDSPLHSINNSKISGVIWKYTIKEHIISQILGTWTNDEKTINESVRSVPFSLMDNGIKVKVANPSKLDSVELSIINEKFVSANNSLADHLWGYLKGIRSTGTQYTEEMLVEGTQVLGVGKLVLDKEILSLKPDATIPYIITTQSKQDVIEDYEVPVSTLRILSFISTCVTLYFSYRIIIKLHKRWKAYKKHCDESKVLTEVKQRSEAKDLDIPESLMCLVCCGLRDILIMPCKHICVCGDCYQKLDPKICPVCRTEIEAIEPVFYS